MAAYLYEFPKYGKIVGKTEHFDRYMAIGQGVKL